VKSLEHLLAAQNKLVPEMVDLLQDRYRMLKYVKMVGPIGRRTLGEMAGLSERETRTMIDLLRTQKLLDINRSGASITTEGIDVLETLESTMEKWSGLTTIAKRLAERLGIQSVKIVAGNADTNAAAKSLLGLEAATEFTSTVGEGKTVAVTGGSTVASIPHFIENFNTTKDLRFIAARGGVGEDIGLQANVIAASFADVCGGTYKTFYYPEALSKEAHLAFKKESSVIEMIQLYDEVDCVIHGIGNAEKMASLRGSSEEEQQSLRSLDAKGEAFGYYFDFTGRVVHRIRTIGIQTEQLKRVPFIISVAGGKSKAEAILSYMATAPKQTILVTDEGAANEMLKIKA